MKFLLLILLAACGKQSPPSFIDANDSDGDQIINAYDPDKYTANIDVVPELTGTVAISNTGETKRFASIEFSNTKDFNKELKKNLFRSSSLIQLEDNFQEKNKLRLRPSKIDLSQNSDKMFDIRLTIKQDFAQKGFLSFVHKKNDNSKKEVKNDLLFRLSREEVTDLLNGKSYFSFSSPKKSSSWDLERSDNIAKKTYRVLIKDGSKAELRYVSKDLPISSYIKMQKISFYTDIDQITISTEENDETYRWWVKKISDDYYYLIHTNMRELKSIFSQSNSVQKIKLSRENGFTKSVINLKNPLKIPIQLKLKSTLLKRTLSTHTEPSNVRANENEYWACSLQIRSVKEYFEEKLTVTQLYNDLEFYTNGVKRPITPESLEINELDGDFLININFSASEIQIRLKTLPEAEYLPTGTYYMACDGKKSENYYNNPLHPEAQMQLIGEAYVEIDAE